MAIIYLIEAVRDYDTVYKIGYTKSENSKKNRIKNLQTGNDGELKFIHEFHTKHGRKVETSIHNYLKQDHKKGEWFDMELSDVVNFPKICEKIEKNFDILKYNPFI